MEPFADALVSSVVRPGDWVLDVACGTGVATRAAAIAAGRSGSVMGSDINAGMLAVAGEVTDRDLIASWDIASALDLPYEDDSFDSVICQQGLQFFPDPVAGLLEMARVTKRDGRVAVTVWSELDRSPYFGALEEMFDRCCGPDRHVDQFAFEEGAVTGWFAGAGLTSAQIEEVRVEVSLPPVTEYVPSHMKALPWAGDFLALDEDKQREAIAHVDSRLSDFRIDSGICVPFGSWLATTTV